MHAPRYTTCASKLQLQREREREREREQAQSLHSSLPRRRPSRQPRLSSPLVSLMRPPPARSGKQRASGLLNNSLCGLAERKREREREMRACARALTRGYFAKLPAWWHPPVSRVLRRRRRYSAAILPFLPRETTGGRGGVRCLRESPKFAGKRSPAIEEVEKVAREMIR